MHIRSAKSEDIQAICDLLKQMGYSQPLALIQEKFELLNHDSKSQILVAEEEGEICGFLSLYFIPQIALQGDFAKICYLCVNENMRSKGVGHLLVQEAEQLAKRHGCDRMELHSGVQRPLAHQFYLREGYVEAPKYFRKALN
ncbi:MULTISPECIES: GNAT family N-acetyltransferase [Acinetobacter]|uniref:GNAT family N-acetyltransferase n=1 Tax=Acinetobacter geminorum TaxID=2730922 RepID=A0ABT8ZD05_9GAMM|nr:MULTISPECIES: GNAT family N-acetyltransferase [Acinetobacter]MBJ9936489.1 GNAT family N-acetyltransferase [Acinetobacter pittii]MCU4363071.1 GNAT family N-acetyltransferase [Acinetobacter sp. WU_MDCI_Abxc22]MDO7362598.1 GNAT family N-acetyltransferase [Acinetobacter geminorum]MEB7642862.1 GNAT family N-acetyltransferase [Acinetobacter pittii]OTL22375.1 GNAT family N-acetyltransferase [Acinetobacter pittii]